MTRLIQYGVIRVLVALAVALTLYLLAIQYGWLSSLDRAASDLGMALRSSPRTAADVVLIAIDRRTITECFPEDPLPLSRHAASHARLIDRLDSAGARLIVLDILFDRVRDYGSTAADSLTAAIGRSGKVIIGAAIEYGTESAPDRSTVLRSAKLAVPPLDVRTAAVACGLLNTPIDPDNCVRRVALTSVFADSICNSLSYAAARLADSGRYPWRYVPSDTLLIDYAWASLPLPVVSYSQVLNHDGWQPLVQGKVVLVGVTQAGEDVDTYRTPLAIQTDRLNRLMPGSEIQALAIQTLLSPVQVRILGRAGALILALLTLLAAFALMTRFSPTFGFIAVIVILLAVPIGALLAAVFLRTVLPAGAMLLGSGAGTLVMFTVNFTAERITRLKRDRELKVVHEELVDASEVQKGLQPIVFPVDPRYEITGRQIPFMEVGGDYFDIAPLEGGRLGLLILDVAGKGIGGSLVMSNVQGRFRYIVRQFTSPAQLLDQLRDVLTKTGSTRHIFATAAYAVFDPDAMQITYANAGHCTPIIVSRDGSVSLCTEAGLPLGPFDSCRLTDATVQLQPGDLLCLYTDGITEAGEEGSERMFGDERLADTLREVVDRPLEGIRDHVLARTKAFAGKHGFDDDWTILLLRVKSPVA